MGKSAENTTIIDSLAKYWVIITFFVGMAVTWGVFSAQFSSAQKDISALRSKVEASDATFTQLKVDIQEIKTTLEFIKDKVR